MVTSTELQKYCLDIINSSESPEPVFGDFSCHDERQSQIQRLKEALIVPFQVNINFFDYAKHESPQPPLARTLWVVADDGEGKRVCFSEQTQQFHLAVYNTKDPSKCSSTVGVFGDLISVYRKELE